MARNSSKRSGLSASTNQKRNTQKRRNTMSRSSFALPKGSGSKPGSAQYRMDDLPHARNARARVMQNGTKSEQRQVFAATAKKYPSLKRSNRRT